MEVMNGASIILLLACGAVVVSADPLSRPDSSAYSGTGRRSQNFNSNVNTNIVSGGPSRPTEEEHNPALEEESNIFNELIPSLSGVPIGAPTSREIRFSDSEVISRKLYSEADPKTASLATSAAEAAMSIVKALTVELSETAAAAVAEAVSRILTGRSEPEYSRRNYNVNMNTNTNIMGNGGERSEDRASSLGGTSSADLLNLGNSLGTQSSDPGLESSNGLPYGTINFDVPHVYGSEHTARAIEGVTHEPDVNANEKDKVISLERLAEIDELENEPEALASKSMGGHGGLRVNRRNTNSNANKIRLNRGRSSNDENEESDLRSSAYRRRVNPTGNSSDTNFRRNINTNSNSNSNNLRRNVNSRMNRRSRTRRD